MSIKVMSRVWEHSGQRGGALLILLALADFADDDGYAWPAVATLATKARMTERNARYALRGLEADGEITTTHGGGRHGTNGYIVKTGATVAGGQNLPGAKRRTKGAKRDIRGGLEIAPEPSLVTVTEPSSSGVSVANDATGESADTAAPPTDAWLPLKISIATLATGKPRTTTAAGKPLGWIGEIVGDVGKIAGGSPDVALTLWDCFEEALTPAEREQYINPRNVGERFGRWSKNGGASTIRAILAQADGGEA